MPWFLFKVLFHVTAQMFSFYIDKFLLAGYLLKYRDGNGRLIERLVEETSVTITELKPLTTYTDISLQTMVDGLLSNPFRFPTEVTTGESYMYLIHLYYPPIKSIKKKTMILRMCNSY